MKNSKKILVTGGCGFVGRNLIKKIYRDCSVWVIDDLSMGSHPDKWLDKSLKLAKKTGNKLTYHSQDSEIIFIIGDVIDIFKEDLKQKFLPEFNQIFHFASIVGGRELIDGDPIRVGRDLAIDSLFFYWLTKANTNPESVLYASSSAAYPVSLQGKKKNKRLREDYINFNNTIGLPDMTYGWSKLSGEYLARITAERYSIPIACIRPFSGYGEDQDFSYPIPAIARRVALKENPLTVWGTGLQGRDFVHIDDCIDAFFIVMKEIKNGDACNIGSGKLTSFLEVLKLFSGLEGYSPRIKKLTGKPVGVDARYADITKIKMLGWKPKITNEQGFGRVLDYIKTNRL